MDTVLHTLLIILFVLVPGFIFRRVYFQGGFSKQFDSKSWSHSLFYSVLFGILIELITLILYTNLYEEINSEALIEFYKCISENIIPNWLFEDKTLISLLVYFVILICCSFGLGYLAYGTVRIFKLDRKFKSLRFNNQWHYYFTGEIKDFTEFKHINGDFMSTHIDALVNTENGKNILYSGFLSEHSICSNTGNLEALYLTFPRRYDQDKKVWKEIDSDVLILPYSKVINLNLRYSFKKSVAFPYEALLFISTTIFIWIDCLNLISDYNLISKILLKSFMTMDLILIFGTITFFREFKNTVEDDKKKEKRKQLIDTIKTLVFLTIILFFIIYFTY